jgi:hypothetical protein
MSSFLESVNTRRADDVVDIFERAAEANLRSPTRRGSVDVVGPDDPTRRLIATGDLHDNPAALDRLAQRAGMTDASATPSAHLTLHEVIHSDRLTNGMDFSYRSLVKVAALKAAFPRHVHTLLANHELSQISGSGIIKDGVSVVQAFNDGVEYVFGGDTARVMDAMGAFIRSMALALRCVAPARVVAAEGTGSADRAVDLFTCHSLPEESLFDRFDVGVFDRALVEEDYVPRRGSAHLLVWGRGHPPELLGTLGERLGVGLFVLGHEHAEGGWMRREPNTLVLNTDGPEAKIAELDLSRAWSLSASPACVELL